MQAGKTERFRIGIMPGGRTLEVEGGRSLFLTLKECGIELASACGGRGMCGLCRVVVKAGGGELTGAETKKIGAADLAAGVRLACQIVVSGDLAIELPDAQALLPRHEGTVESLEDLTHDVRRVRVRLDAEAPLAYRAGQYMQLEVPPHEHVTRAVTRSYSLASAPHEKGVLEFMIRLVPNGVATTWVHRFLRVGDRVRLRGPCGDFFLSGSDRPVVCIAGGSGMAPIRSILADMAARGIRRKTRFFFGAVSGRDLYLVDEMKQFEKTLPDFRFIPALSAPRPEDGGWSGETGLITEVVKRHLAGVRDAEAYLCGSPGMIGACLEVLAEDGIAEESVFYDSF